MNREEKLLMLQLVAEDLSGNWSQNMLEERIEYLEELGDELLVCSVDSAISEFWESVESGYPDGENFEYMDLEESTLSRTIMDKSKEFITNAEAVLTHPSLAFSDWKEYKNTKSA